MSIFDLFDDSNLPGDKAKRKLGEGTLEYEHFKKDAEGGEIFQNEPRSLWAAYGLCLLVFGVLFAQVLNLQVTHGSSNRILAEGNRIRAREINPPRGLIFDANKKILAKNTATFSLEIYPLDLPKKQEDRLQIYETLSQIAQISVTDIQNAIAQKGLLTYDPVILKENIDRDTALILKVRTANLAGVGIAANPVREYVTTPGLATILGYVGKVSDRDLKNNPNYKSSYEIGKDGLEAYYEKYLRGVPGISEIEVDSRGRQQRELASTQPMPGNNLILSLNSDLEAVLANSLSSVMSSSKATGGIAVAMNPQTGQILGMVSLPSYDNNLFTRPTASEEYQKLANDPSTPLFNRAISGTYPSGSIIKPMMAAMGLQEGVITPVTTINDPGSISVGSWNYPDWKAHGYVDVRKALAESCDVFFYAVAGGWDKIKGLGIDRMKTYLTRFGFGQKSGIDLPGEASGVVPDPKWKQQVKNESWYLGDSYHLGIGQGDFLVTPLQMVAATSVIANGGQLLEPKMVNQITDKDGTVIEEFQKKVVRENFISSENIATVRSGMRQAVTSGSARSLNDLPVAVAAKTGTAQFEVAGKTHAWMTAYAPYENPTFAIAVLVEQGGEGYAEAGPVVHEALRWYFSQ